MIIRIHHILLNSFTSLNRTVSQTSTSHLTFPFPTKSHPSSPSHSLNVNRPIFLLNDPIIRPIPFLNLPPNRLILLHINPRSRQLRRQLIPANHNRRVRLEESIDVFESAVGGFGVEEVGYWDEGEADAGLCGVLVGVELGRWGV